MLLIISHRSNYTVNKNYTIHLPLVIPLTMGLSHLQAAKRITNTQYYITINRRLFKSCSRTLWKQCEKASSPISKRQNC